MPSLVHPWDFSAGRLFDRIGPRKVILPGAFISFVGGLGLVALNLDTPIVFIICVYTCLSGWHASDYYAS